MGDALRAPFPISPLDHAVALVKAGVLRVEADGTVWRVGIISRGFVLRITPRRAERTGHKGYLRIVLGVPGERRTFSVGAHRLVYAALRGCVPDDLQINHIDLNKTNNHPDNLELVTAAQNIAHSYANGRTTPWSAVRARRGSWRGKPLVSSEQAAAMREMRANGATLAAVAREFGISITHTQRLTARAK